MNAARWREEGRLCRVGRRHVFVVDTGGKKPVLVILHGYPTSSFDYWRVLPRLAETYRVVVHDHLGFGFSDKPLDYSYSLIEQADHAILAWQELGITRAHLLAHDYGTSVATEIIARYNLGHRPIQLDSLTLCNGSMHIELARLRPMQRMLKNSLLGPLVARWASERLFARNIRKIFADPSRIGDDELHAMWTMLVANGGRAVLPRVSQYLDERRRFWHRWIHALRETDVPTNIVWARHDPVAVEQMAHVLHDEIRHSRLELLDDVGHFPMIEAPDAWASAVLARLATP